MFFYKLHPDAQTPIKKNPEDAGFDFFALEDVVLRPGEVKTVSTGIAVGLHEHAFVWDRSGNGSKGVKTLGGVIDEPYVGEIKIVVANLNNWALWELLLNSPKYYNEQEQDHIIQVRNMAVHEAIHRSTVTIPRNKGLAQLIHSDTKMNELSEVEFKKMFRLRFSPEALRGTKGFGSSDN